MYTGQTFLERECIHGITNAGLSESFGIGGSKPEVAGSDQITFFTEKKKQLRILGECRLILKALLID